MQVLLVTQDTAHHMHLTLAGSRGLSRPQFIHLSLGDNVAVLSGFVIVWGAQRCPALRRLGVSGRKERFV